MPHRLLLGDWEDVVPFRLGKIEGKTHLGEKNSVMVRFRCLLSTEVKTSNKLLNTNLELSNLTWK